MWMSPAIFMTILLLLVVLSWQRGGRDEHLAAIILLFASFLTPMLVHQDFHQAECAVLAIDAVVLVSLCFISLKSDRYWPLFAAGWQLVNVAVHLTMLISPAVLPAAYANALAIWSYLVVFAPIAGIIIELQNGRRQQWRR